MGIRDEDEKGSTSQAEALSADRKVSARSIIGLTVGLVALGGCASASVPEAVGPWNPSNLPVVRKEPDCHVVVPDLKARRAKGEIPQVGIVSIENESIPLRYFFLGGRERDRRLFSGTRAQACRLRSGLDSAKRSTFVVAEGDACFIGVLAGENNSGTFRILENGREVFLSVMDSPMLLARIQGRLILVWFDGHQGRWGLSRVARDNEGRWHLESSIERDGHLWGYAFDSNERLLLRVWEPAPQWCESNWRLYRLMEDGRLEVLG